MLKIQPIRFPGRFATSRAPTTVNIPNPAETKKSSAMFSPGKAKRRSSQKIAAMPPTKTKTTSNATARAKKRAHPPDPADGAWEPPAAALSVGDTFCSVNAGSAGRLGPRSNRTFRARPHPAASRTSRQRGP